MSKTLQNNKQTLALGWWGKVGPNQDYQTEGSNIGTHTPHCQWKTLDGTEFAWDGNLWNAVVKTELEIKMISNSFCDTVLETDRGHFKQPSSPGSPVQ